MSSAQDLIRLRLAFLGGVIFAVALCHLLLVLDTVTVFDNVPPIVAGIAGLGLGLLRFAGPSPRCDEQDE